MLLLKKGIRFLCRATICRNFLIWVIDLGRLRKPEKELFLKKNDDSYPVCKQKLSIKEKQKLYRRYLSLWISYGFDIKDFFIYRLYRYSDKECSQYISHEYWLYLDSQVNEKDYWDIFEDKAVFYHYFKKFMKRDLLIVDNENQKEAFYQMCNRYDKILVKPRRSHRGEGIIILPTGTVKEIDAAWKIVVKDRLLVEEIIDQYEYMSQFNKNSLNTIRVCTAQDGQGNIHIMACTVRMGTGNAIVDNVSNGSGLFAGVDKNSGTVFSVGFDVNSKEYIYHPDNKIVIPGRKIPNWEQLKKLTVEVAKIIPQMKYLGWDWALNSQGDWELVEGNNPGAMIMSQTVLNKGLKKEYDFVLFKL